MAPEGGAGAGGGLAGASAGASGAAGAGAQAGAAAGSGGAGGAGAAGAAGMGGAGAGGSADPDAGAAAASAGAAGGAADGSAGAMAGASGAGGAPDMKPWCLDPWPSTEPPFCADLNVQGATSNPTTTDCPYLPKKTVDVFGPLPCKRCSTASGHTLAECLAGTASKDYHYQGSTISCSEPAFYCVTACTECQ